MSILTKLFTVILVVASIVFTTVAVSTTARTTDWKKLANDYEAQYRIADTTIRNQNAAAAAQIATLRDSINAYDSRDGALRAELAKAREEINAKDIALKQAVADRASAEAMNRGLLAQLSVSENNAEEYRKQRDSLEQRNMDMEKRNLDLNERVNEETAQIAVLLEQRRQYEQQINILKSENEVLSQKARAVATGAQLEHPTGAGIAQVTALTPIASTAVRGRVLEIDSDIVTLSVGSADGVKDDMVFVIFRGSQYVGDVKISVVEPNKSAGRLTQSSVAPRADDQVIDEAHLRAARG